MRSGRLIFALGLVVAVAVMAATAGARVDAAHKTTTITFWHAYSSDGPEVKRIEKVLIPTFEKEHPNIKVKAVAIPYDSLHQKLVTAVAGGQLPDLVRSDIIWVPELANLGVLEPLDKTMPDFKSISKKVFAGAARDELLEGSLLRAPARHEYADLDLQPGCAAGRGAFFTAKELRAAEVDVGGGKGEGALPLRRIGYELLERLPVDLVKRRCRHEQELHQGLGISELPQERGGGSDARRSLQGWRDAEDHRRFERWRRNLRRNRPEEVRFRA